MMSLLFLVVLCCIVFYTFFGYLIRVQKRVQLLKSVPGPPKENAVLGNMSYALRGPSIIPRFFMKHSENVGGLTVFWICHIPFVFVTEASFAEIFFTDKGTRSKSSMYKYLDTWLGQGLLTNGGKKWWKHRKLLTPAFHFSILISFCEKFAKISEILVEKLKKQPEGTFIDVFEIMGLTTLDGLCETAMSAEINALKDTRLDYVHSTERSSLILMERMFKPWHWSNLTFFMMSVGRKLREYLDIIFRLHDEMIENRRNKIASHGEEIIKSNCVEAPENKQRIFLDILLEAADSTSIPFTEKDVKDEVATFMFEGHETTTSALSFALYLLGLHPEIQTKCFEELVDIFQNSNRRPTSDDLQRMQYLERVIKESLRLFPSVPMVARETTQDVHFEKYTVPEGVILALNLFILHRDPRYFPDPEKFDPDRFLPENTANRHPFAYVPFAAGARNCIGQKFAMMEMKVVTSYILRNFELESAYGRDQLKLNFGLTLRSKKSLDVKFKPRGIIQNYECKN